MGANVELDIFLKKEGFSLQEIFSLLEARALNTRFVEMRVFDDWKYTNEVIIDTSSIDIYTSNVFLNNFTLVHFIINDKWRCVLLTSLVEDIYIDLSFGLQVDDLLQYKENNSEDAVLFLYNRVTDVIDTTSSKQYFKDRFIAASMGIEYSIDFNSNIMKMLNDDNGVERWILPKDTAKYELLKKFTKEEKSATIILTRSS